MFSIKNADGEVVQVCRRKNAIRKYAARHNGVRSVRMDVKGGFWMTVVFGNASFTKVNFPRYDYMKGFIYNWTGATNAPLNINGGESGLCNKKNFSIM